MIKERHIMELGEAIQIVIELATNAMVDDHVLINDPQLLDEQQSQQEAINTVEDFFVNNVFA
jgi:hypothetical protein